MIDFSKSDYQCDGQMTLEECMKEIDNYKWETGQYMPLPEVEETQDEYNRVYSEGKQERHIPEKSLRRNRIKR